MNRLAYSVILPSCRRPQMLREAVASVLKQTLPAREIFVIIDEPEDRHTYQDVFDRGAPLIVEFTGGGRGAAVARNIGLRRATSDYVLFLDDDDLWYPHKAERQVDLLERQPECIGVTCWREIEHAGKVHVETVTEDRVNDEIRLTNHVGSFSFFGMRRAGVATTHLIDEELPGSEDFDFYMTLATEGRIAVVPEVLVRYRQHSGPRMSNDLKRLVAARRRIIAKHSREMTWSERMWNRGRMVGIASGAIPNRGVAMLLLGWAGVLLAVSGRPPQESARLIWRSWKTRSIF